jgi:hypothetical protein
MRFTKEPDMLNSAYPQTASSLKPLAPFERAWQANRLLTLAGLGSLVLLSFAAVMAVFDPRLITGAPAWVKPMKFAISTVFYTLTLAWMLSYVQGRPRLVATVSIVTVVGLAIELALIVLQVARGVRSHFNVSTALDGAIFSTMGATIIVIWLMNLLAALLVLRQPFTDRAFGWSLRLGLLLTAVGAGVAFLMTSPTAEQLAQLQSGAAPTFIGAHAVGVPDGGAGLPFLGWSTEGGDLRIAHFVGLHALQTLPLLGFLVNRAFAGLSERRRTALVVVGGAGYLGLIVALAWQALRGQSIIAPDALTLAVFAALLGAVALAGFAIAAPASKIPAA